MIIRHNALILVADGMKYLLLRNTGDIRRVSLTFEGGGEMENPATSAQGSDEPGRAFSAVGTARSAVDQTDWHQMAEDRFAARVADMLGTLAEARDFEDLIVVAPPKCLAILRKTFDDKVSSRIVAEIDKDLTKHPVAEIAEILGGEGD